MNFKILVLAVAISLCSGFLNVDADVEETLKFMSNPLTVVPGLTRLVKARCNAGSRSNGIVSIVISKWNSNAEHFTELAKVTYQSPDQAEPMNDAQAQTLGTIQKGAHSFLEVQWADPGTDAAGTYMCEVTTLGVDGHPTNSSRKFELPLGEVDTSQLLAEIRELERSQEDLESVVAELYTKLDDTDVLLAHLNSTCGCQEVSEETTTAGTTATITTTTTTTPTSTSTSTFTPTTTFEICNRFKTCNKKVIQSADGAQAYVCFREYWDKKGWNRANDYCKRYGGRLVEVHDEETLDFITENTKILSDWAWMGARRHGVEGTWRWESGPRLNLSRWVTGEPNNLGEKQNCMVMFYKDATWRGSECNIAEYRAFCETTSPFHCSGEP